MDNEVTSHLDIKVDTIPSEDKCMERTGFEQPNKFQEFSQSDSLVPIPANEESEKIPRRTSENVLGISLPSKFIKDLGKQLDQKEREINIARQVDSRRGTVKRRESTIIEQGNLMGTMLLGLTEKRRGGYVEPTGLKIVEKRMEMINKISAEHTKLKVPIANLLNIPEPPQEVPQRRRSSCVDKMDKFEIISEDSSDNDESDDDKESKSEIDAELQAHMPSKYNIRPLPISTIGRKINYSVNQMRGSISLVRKSFISPINMCSGIREENESIGQVKEELVDHVEQQQDVLPEGDENVSDEKIQSGELDLACKTPKTIDRKQTNKSLERNSVFYPVKAPDLKDNAKHAKVFDDLNLDFLDTLNSFFEHKEKSEFFGDYNFETLMELITTAKSEKDKWITILIRLESFMKVARRYMVDGRYDPTLVQNQVLPIFDETFDHFVPSQAHLDNKLNKTEYHKSYSNIGRICPTSPFQPQNNSQRSNSNSLSQKRAQRRVSARICASQRLLRTPGKFAGASGIISNNKSGFIQMSSSVINNPCASNIDIQRIQQPHKPHTPNHHLNHRTSIYNITHKVLDIKNCQHRNSGMLLSKEKNPTQSFLLRNASTTFGRKFQTMDLDANHNYYTPTHSAVGNQRSVIISTPKNHMANNMHIPNTQQNNLMSPKTLQSSRSQYIPSDILQVTNNKSGGINALQKGEEESRKVDSFNTPTKGQSVEPLQKHVSDVITRCDLKKKKTSQKFLMSLSNLRVLVDTDPEDRKFSNMLMNRNKSGVGF